ncbi:hypothetical protein ACFQJ8_21610 [Halocatena marina]|uniref:hypothetical protein n=1 Tax=Halocatena marina TaxID=2934937 RepID=UPI00361F5185
MLSDLHEVEISAVILDNFDRWVGHGDPERHVTLGYPRDCRRKLTNGWDVEDEDSIK